MPEIVHRTCTLCEAMCGLTYHVEQDKVLSVAPDPDDVFSHGYACPKGIANAAIHEDPDRLRHPVRRTPGGDFEEVSWEAAFDEAAARLAETRDRHGRDAVGVYYGNPSVHQHGTILVLPAFLKALGTRNRFNANSQDANPRLAVSHYLYGASLVLPIPDLDRTGYFLCVGANPVVSNGSVLSAPNLRGRLRAIRRRGGRVVVVDPRASETAREADEHLAVRPGGDAALLLGMVAWLHQQRRLSTPPEGTRGWERIAPLLDRLDVGRCAEAAGVPVADLRRIALEFSRAKGAACYTRTGVSLNERATLATWAADLLNIATGNLGRAGGMLFPRPAIDLLGVLRSTGVDGHGRWRTRVRGLPETASELPAAALAEEIETPGPGQIRALVTVAGNPVLSVPNGPRLSRALERLDFMVSLDIYVNETTRYADLILPTAWALAQDHIDLLFPHVAVRNGIRWSPAVLPREPGERADWEILLELSERLGGGLTGRPGLDAAVRLARRLGWRLTPTTLADWMLRLGPRGDRFLPGSRGLSLKRLRAAPHGVDLGPLDEGFAWRIQHADRRVRLDPDPILAEAERLVTELEAPLPAPPLVLIGRRDVRSNNSWMHNAAGLVSGRERCVLWVHPRDAERAGVGDGDVAVLESRVHRGRVRVRLTDTMRPGVVSLPHGWGHAAAGRWQRVAARQPGVSANDWTDDERLEAVVGQSILNGVPVRLERGGDPASRR